MTTSDTTKSASNYRGLLALVILLGMAIMLAVGALIGAAYVNARGGGIGRGGAPAPVQSDNSRSIRIDPLVEPFLVDLASSGQTIESAQIRDGQVLVRLSGPRGQELVVIDVGNGRIIGRIALNASP